MSAPRVSVSRREAAINHWEASVVDARDKRLVSTEEARAVVQYVWQRLELPYCPLVATLAPGEEGHVPGAYATCSDTTITLMRPVNTCTLLHEIAHAITEDPLDRMELRQPVERLVHGDIWLGNYIHLLSVFMGPAYNKPYLMSTLPQGAGLSPAWHALVRGKIVR